MQRISGSPKGPARRLLLHLAHVIFLVAGDFRFRGLRGGSAGLFAGEHQPRRDAQTKHGRGRQMRYRLSASIRMPAMNGPMCSTPNARAQNQPKLASRSDGDAFSTRWPTVCCAATDSTLKPKPIITAITSSVGRDRYATGNHAPPVPAKCPAASRAARPRGPPSARSPARSAPESPRTAP